MTAARHINNMRYSEPTGLWCPYCHEPFVGTVDRRTGQFVHGSCPVAELDAQRLEALAGESWFWARFRDRIFGRD
jgi:hypothetical protein